MCTQLILMINPSWQVPKNVLQPSENNNDMVGTVDKDDALSREKQPIGNLGLGTRIRISQLLHDKYFVTINEHF